MITRNNCGIAVLPDSMGDFADALEKLANSRELTKKMGENARQFAEREFDREKLGNIFVDFLEKIVKK